MNLTALALVALTIPTFAVVESFETKSEKGKFIVKFRRDAQIVPYRVSVCSEGGQELFVFEAGLSVAKDSLLWNESGTALAFAAGDPFLMATRILYIDDRRWSVVLAPSPEDGWDNYYQIPQAWDGDILSLKIDGPHGGRSNGYWYSGTMAFQVSAPKATARTVSEKIDVVSVPRD